MFLARALATGTDPHGPGARSWSSRWRWSPSCSVRSSSSPRRSSSASSCCRSRTSWCSPCRSVRGIESVPWWITLAIVGAVLLIIAVTYERRSGGRQLASAAPRPQVAGACSSQALAATQAKPSGSVNAPASLETLIRCDPLALGVHVRRLRERLALVQPEPHGTRTQVESTKLPKLLLTFIPFST